MRGYFETMATEPKTYRVSAEVDGEIGRLAKIHGGVDRALRSLLFADDREEVAAESRQRARAAAPSNPATIPGVQVGAADLPKNAVCRHCGAMFAGSRGATICPGCSQDGHRGDVRNCAECGNSGTGGL